MSIIIDPNAIDFGQYLEDQSFLEAQSIKPPSHFRDKVLDILKYGDRLMGATLPWNKSHDFVRVGDGKLSIWAGVNGSGKSMLLGQVITNLMEQGRKACIASLEMHPEQTLSRMINQSAGCPAGTSYGSRWMEAFEDRLRIYDQLDRIATDRILGMVHYAANELGSVDIVIDSLARCGVGPEDWTAQTMFIDRLHWCAKRYRVHIHLICHMKKKQTPGHVECKDDIAGSGMITNLADNVFILRRNKTKEAEAEKRTNGQDYDDGELLGPCAMLAVEKNRDYGHEPTFRLWFDQPSGQFMASHGPALPPLELF